MIGEVAVAGAAGVAAGAGGVVVARTARAAGARLEFSLLAAQVTAFAAAAVGALVTWPHVWRGADVVWSLAAGVALGLALVAIVEAVGAGSVATAGAVALPVAATTGVAAGLALGERPGPLAVAGAVVAAAAGGLVALGDRADPHARLVPRERFVVREVAATSLRWAALAGLTLGACLVLGSRARHTPGWVPTAIVLGAALTVSAGVLASRVSWRRPPRPSPVLVLVAGGLLALAVAAAIESSRDGDVVWAVPLASLASVTVWALIGRAERLGSRRSLGLAMAAVAVVLVAVGR
ncbi:MAG: hypothetical protein U0Q03_18665 [Acidimicrobiales bacterium]